MLIQKGKFKTVTREMQERVTQDVYGCDECRTEIDLNKKDETYLEATIFRGRTNTESEHRIFCSWKCVIKNLRKVKTDYFIAFPYLTFDTPNKRVHPREFFKLFKDL